ncbi:MAG: quinolinate synthase NadA, partial [Candidatus Marinimicrobia bacterium]|nr:quinolinate synthase NadA [Candidatus Neomarinimicrobiota bacterium]
FCGRHGGACCTSGNAAQVFRWAFAAGRRIFFLPDEHLGRNTAAELGLPDEAVACYDPTLPQGGLTPAQLTSARVVVWKGFCHVHTRFEVDQIKLARARFPEARIIVHPETPREALVLCDANGSTSRIIRYVAEAPAGSTILIGTELHLVQRLATQYADRLTIHPLWPSTCWNMAKTTAESLAALLEAWPPQRRIRVRLDTAEEARGALDRMLAC